MRISEDAKSEIKNVDFVSALKARFSTRHLQQQGRSWAGAVYEFNPQLWQKHLIGLKSVFSL